MINELSLLRLNPETASTKQKIIDLLSNEYPLNAKKVHHKLQKLYSVEISYQGVHKLLKEMETQKIIEKKRNEYLLSIDWIQKSKKTLETVEKKYLQNEKIIIPEDFSGSIELEFDSITDLCVSMAELLMSRQLSQGSDDPSFICTLEYGYWGFKFKFEHLELLFNTIKSNPEGKVIIRKQTPFGGWIRGQYCKIGAVCPLIACELDIENDLFVQGDCITQIKFDEETKKIIEYYYNKWKSLNDVFKEFGLKEEPKIHATMRITKNPEMANYLRKQLNKVFEGDKK